MAQKKKLQVFVSSTYEDLKEERQAAVQAILTAGHIPAGMELFAAGDESQMDVIKRWIDESDVYLLILGGRYGSVEPKSGKSYTHLEFDYAVAQGKPLFSIVIKESFLDDRVRQVGPSILEREHPEKLRAFQEEVKKRLVKFWSDSRDIQIAIYGALKDYESRSDLIGWIPGNTSVDTGALAEEMARQSKENSALQEEVSKLKEQVSVLATPLASQFLSEEELKKISKVDIRIVLKRYLSTKGLDYEPFILNYRQASDELGLSRDIIKYSLPDAVLATDYAIIHTGEHLMELRKKVPAQTQ